MMGRRILVLVALLATLVTVRSEVQAGGILTVTKFNDTNDGQCGSDCSLREAINEANAVNDLTEVILPAGRFVLSLTFGAGDLQVTTPVVITGAGAKDTVITGNDQWAERIFDVAANGYLDMSDVKITGGNAKGFDEVGGGIKNSGTLLLRDVRVTKNKANDNGGGVANLGDFEGTRLVFARNIAENGGGAVSSAGLDETELENVVLKENKAFGGGAIFTSSNFTLEDAKVVNNRATAVEGGAIYQLGNSMEIENATISGNHAPGDGGAIFASGGTMDISHATISGNSSTRNGGGIAIAGSDPVQITNVTVSGNEATENGGGIDVASGEAILWFATVANNAADTTGSFVGGGLADRNGDTSSFASLFAGNTESAGNASTFDCSTVGGVVSSGGNAYGTNSACADIPDFTSIDAKLGALASNGGPNKTHKIGATSGARDTVSGGDPNCSSLGSRDQRQVPRPQGGCDAGAYEIAFCRGVLVNIVGTNLSETIRGTNGNDGILALFGNDTVSGLDGNDAICAGGGDDLLKGGSGRDRLDGEDNNDDCRGGPDADQFFACETVSE